MELAATLPRPRVLAGFDVDHPVRRLGRNLDASPYDGTVCSFCGTRRAYSRLFFVGRVT